MSSEAPRPIIEVKNLGKSFSPENSPAQRFFELFRDPQRANPGPQIGVLEDITFVLNPGESVGIVGRNGAGKSTLLKILSGTLTPTQGQVVIRGTVAAILELGAGFNPNFSGRENAKLYAQILGFKPQGLNRLVEQAIEFAELEEHAEKPTKTYSSGMVVRLAFAISVARSPDILIVDEALAVGDEAFKRKCFARIEELRRSGTTILFVSHSSGLVSELCDRALLIEEGRLLLDGATTAVLKAYSRLLYASKADRSAIATEISKASAADPLLDTPIDTSSPLPADGRLAACSTPEVPAIAPPTSDYDVHLKSKSAVHLTERGGAISDLKITDEAGRQVNVLLHDQAYTLSYKVAFQVDANNVDFGMMIRTVTGMDIGGGIYPAWNQTVPHIPAGSIVTASFTFHTSLNPGTYFVNAGVRGSSQQHTDSVYIHRIIDASMFRIQELSHQSFTGTSKLITNTSVKIHHE